MLDGEKRETNLREQKKNGDFRVQPLKPPNGSLFFYFQQLYRFVGHGFNNATENRPLYSFVLSILRESQKYRTDTGY